MLGSMGTKGGSVLYHIGYGGYNTSLVCLNINGVTDCCQPRCWLISVGWVTKPNCDRIYGIITPTYIVGMLIITCGREVMSSSFINFFNLSSTKGYYWIHVQHVDNMHRLMQFQR